MIQKTKSTFFKRIMFLIAYGFKFRNATPINPPIIPIIKISYNTITIIYNVRNLKLTIILNLWTLNKNIKYKCAYYKSIKNY